MITHRLADGVMAAITDRHGGVSAQPYDTRNLGGACGDVSAAVAENRAGTAGELGLDPEHVVYMRQVHGTDVRYVTGPFGDFPPAVDAVITDVTGLALGVLVADCAPVLVADPRARIIGAAHSGREGTARGVVPTLVKNMIELGAEPDHMIAMVGPAACGRCYEVSAELRDQVAAAVPESRSATRRGTPALDLRAGITAQLNAGGVRTILHDDRCTIERQELYSYRRERHTGRFAGFIWLAAGD